MKLKGDLGGKSREGHGNYGKLLAEKWMGRDRKLSPVGQGNKSEFNPKFFSEKELKDKR